MVVARKRTAKRPVGDLLQVGPGPVDLGRVDPHATPGFKGGKTAAEAARAELADRLSTLQGQLFAEGRSGGRRSVLLVLQGMDTSGKGGAIKRVVGQVNPSGVSITAFGRPTPTELKHDFLWRIRRALPGPGQIGVFDRSHYEDVVAARVRGTAERRTWIRRYGSINRFEEGLAEKGTLVIKCFLHISRAEQRARLLARLDDPTKRWKFNPGDLDDRELWDDYMAAYQDALERCSTPAAPWYVIPADRKWYRDWAVSTLLVERLGQLGLSWPQGSFDIAEMKARLES